MASDVLSALLGILAGGAGSYVETKETRRREGLASKEAAAERGSRKELLQTELTSREKEGAANRMTEKELTVMKLQAERDNLTKQLQAQLDRAASANSIERDKINVERDRLTAEIDRVDKEIKFKEKELGVTAGLKRRELDIEQGVKLGTGKYAPAAGTNPLLNSLPDLLKAYVSARGEDMKPDEAIGFLRTVINMNFVNPPVTPGEGGIEALGKYPSSKAKGPYTGMSLLGDLLKPILNPRGFITERVAAEAGRNPNFAVDQGGQTIPLSPINPSYSSPGVTSTLSPGELNFGPQPPNPELEGLFNSIFSFSYERDKPLVTRSSYLRRERGNNIRTLK